ncbi:hypothetical protein VNO80_21382 [Phaseolus coccineus]|uniref:Uncharacterized protein n=1 Tax=Phaseolus coccineus TaxID=3886 RepID=A0AAN9M355_PHACN
MKAREEEYWRGIGGRRNHVRVPTSLSHAFVRASSPSILYGPPPPSQGLLSTLLYPMGFSFTAKSHYVQSLIRPSLSPAHDQPEIFDGLYEAKPVL